MNMVKFNYKLIGGIKLDSSKLMIIGGILLFSWIPLAFIITADRAFWIGLIGFALILIGMSWEKSNRAEKLISSKEKSEKRLSDLKDFKLTQKGYFDNDASILAIDNENKILCIIRYGMSADFYSYKSILQSEVIEDGISVTKTSRGSQIGGVLVGGILAGGVGAIIGGLSGSQETSQEVKKVQLQIIINDTQNPIKTLTFLNTDLPIKKSDPKYKSAYERANHWQKVMSVIINQVDEEDKQNERNNLKETISISKGSTADELKKLAELKRDGILTDEEFNQQKQKLLSN